MNVTQVIAELRMGAVMVGAHNSMLGEFMRRQGKHDVDHARCHHAGDAPSHAGTNAPHN